MYRITFFVWPVQFTCQSLIDITIISASCKSVASTVVSWNLKPWVYSQLNCLPHLQGGVVKFDIGEVLVCHRDTRNRHDPFGVATCKGMTVIGHVRVL